MKGFIEVTGHIDKRKHIVNVAHIIDFFYSKEQECSAIIMSNSDDGKAFGVRETCSELKALIEEATKPTFCNECPYSYDKTLDDALSTVGFEGTMDALNRLKIRKEEVEGK